MMMKRKGYRLRHVLCSLVLISDVVCGQGTFGQSGGNPGSPAPTAASSSLSPSPLTAADTTDAPLRNSTAAPASTTTTTPSPLPSLSPTRTTAVPTAVDDSSTTLVPTSTTTKTSITNSSTLTPTPTADDKTTGTNTTQSPTQTQQPSSTLSPTAIDDSAESAEESQQRPATPADAAVAESKECIDSLDDLDVKMASQDPVTRTVYILCPNTVYNVGVTDENGACCIGGQPAITPRSNAVIQCGANGHAANNCVLRGGEYQLLAVDVYSGERHINAFEMKGIIFESGYIAGLLLVQSGDFWFQDCIFRDHSNNGGVQLLYQPTLSQLERRRNLVEKHGIRLHGTGSSSSPADDLHEVDVRDLAEAELFEAPRRQRVTFQGCIFEGNTQGEVLSPATRHGIISFDSDFTDLTVNECIFRNNHFDTEPKGYAISMQAGGSTLKLRQNCFYGNVFFGSAPVEVVVTGNEVDFQHMVSEDSNAGDGDPITVGHVQCPFLAQIHDPDSRTKKEITCFPFAATNKCPVDGAELTTALTISASSRSLYRRSMFFSTSMIMAVGVFFFLASN